MAQRPDHERWRCTVCCAPLPVAVSSNGNSRLLCAWAVDFVGPVVDYLVFPAISRPFSLALIEFADADAARQLVGVGRIRDLNLGADMGPANVRFWASTHVIRRTHDKVFPEEFVFCDNKDAVHS